MFSSHFFKLKNVNILPMVSAMSLLVLKNGRQGAEKTDSGQVRAKTHYRQDVWRPGSALSRSQDGRACQQGRHFCPGTSPAEKESLGYLDQIGMSRPVRR